MRPAIASNGKVYLRPLSLTTEAHGNPWTVSWNSGEVWLATKNEYTDQIGESTKRYYNEAGAEILPPHLFVVEDSNGVYPNTNHERGIFSHPGEGSKNRSCVNGHPSIFCNFIETAGMSHRLRYPVYPIWVKRDNNAVNFLSLNKFPKSIS